jgi:chromosome segregation ATPase
MKSVVRSVLEPRPPSRPKTLETDVTRAFASLEEDILSTQNYVERLKVKGLDSGVHRGRLQSRRSLRHSSKSSSSCVETSMTLQNYRNSTLTEPIYNLIIATLGSQYSAIPSETVLRLCLLKIKLHEVLIKKIGEILAVKLEVDTENDGKVIGLLFKLIDSNPENKESREYDGKVKELENLVESLRNEAKKESKSAKDYEDIIFKLKSNEKNKCEELESLGKKVKELEVDRGRVSLLVGEMEKLRKKLSEADINESRITFLQSELEKNNLKLNDLADSLEKSVRENKKLKETIEKNKTLEKSLQSQIDSLTKDLLESKQKSLSFEQQFQESKAKEILDLSTQFDSKLQKISKSKDDQFESLLKEKDSLESSLKNSEMLSKSIISELKSSNNDLSQELHKLKQDFDKLSSELQSLKVTQSLLQADSQDQHKKIIDLEDSLRIKTTELQESSLKQQELSNQLKSSGVNQETEKFLYGEIYKMRAELTQVSWKLDERLIINEKLESDVKNLKNDLAKSRAMSERLQDELAKANSAFDEDTFENVMRNELAIMRETYEKRVKEARDEIDTLKRKNMLELKKVKDDLKASEHSKDYLEIRLKALNAI